MAKKESLVVEEPIKEEKKEQVCFDKESYEAKDHEAFLKAVEEEAAKRIVQAMTAITGK